jgi:hypothetical protein
MGGRGGRSGDDGGGQEGGEEGERVGGGGDAGGQGSSLQLIRGGGGNPLLAQERGRRQGSERVCIHRCQQSIPTSRTKHPLTVALVPSEKTVVFN